MARVLIPIPDRDFDPTEVAVTWRVLREKGHAITFATETGAVGRADDIMVTGRGLDLWSSVPMLNRITLVGSLLGANADARAAYAAMLEDSKFRAPKKWARVEADEFDGLFLPGGHRAEGMRSYLESPTLQRLVVAFMAAGKPVAAICHGVLLAARSIDPATGKSVLFGRKTTALTWGQEKLAWTIGRISRFWDPNYYRTYLESAGEPAGYMSVQSEVTRALADADDFRDVPYDDRYFKRKTQGTARDTMIDDTPAFVVEDGNYLSARWPGDAHTLAKKFDAVLRAAP
jgi:putative intracellular protease/amidase